MRITIAIVFPKPQSECVITLLESFFQCFHCLSSSIIYIKPHDRKEYKKFLDDMHTGDFTPVSWFIVCSHNDMHCAVNSVIFMSASLLVEMLSIMGERSEPES